METKVEPDDENPPHNSEYGKYKYLQQTLNSINAFLLSQVISYVVSNFKLLRMSWYKIMKPFRENLKLVINKYLCGMHDYFTGVDSSSKNIMLSVTSKNISLPFDYNQF